MPTFTGCRAMRVQVQFYNVPNQIATDAKAAKAAIKAVTDSRTQTTAPTGWTTSGSVITEWHTVSVGPPLI